MICKKDNKTSIYYNSCDKRLYYYRFNQILNNLYIVLLCEDKHFTCYNIDKVVNEDKPYIHDLLKISLSKFAVCNLNINNNCCTDKEKILCVNKSFQNYRDSKV